MYVRRSLDHTHIHTLRSHHCSPKILIRFSFHYFIQFDHSLRLTFHGFITTVSLHQRWLAWLNSKQCEVLTGRRSTLQTRLSVQLETGQNGIGQNDIGQNDIGQNGIGQNGKDNMVWTNR